jgi:ribosomal protein S18 acetylase RimI-like enzyme
VSFTTSATLALPAWLTVSYWNGHEFVPVNAAALYRRLGFTRIGGRARYRSRP